MDAGKPSDLRPYRITDSDKKKADSNTQIRLDSSITFFTKKNSVLTLIKSISFAFLNRLQHKCNDSIKTHTFPQKKR